MGSQDAVSPTADRINQHLQYATDATFDTYYVGVGDGFLPDDIQNNLFETIPGCGPYYDCSVYYDVQYKHFLNY